TDVQVDQFRVVEPEWTQEIVRVVGDPVTGAYYQRVGDAIRQPRARHKQLLAHAHATIARHYPVAADKHFVCREVVQFHTALGARRHREVLPAEAIGGGEFAADLPLVLHVRAVLPTA